MHGIGDAVHEIDDAKEDHKRPALQLHIEGQIDYHGGQQDADSKPRLEFAPPGTGALDDVAHDRVIEGVKYAGRYHDDGDRGQLRGGELMGKKDECQKVTGDKVVHHVTSDSAKREHPKVALFDTLVFQDKHSVSFTEYGIRWYKSISFNPWSRNAFICSFLSTRPVRGWT